MPESKLLEQVLASLPDGILLLNTDGKIHYLNPVAAEMLAQPLNQILGKYLHNIFPQTKNLKDRVAKTLETGHRFIIREDEWTNPLRQSYVLEFVFDPLYSDEGSITGARLILRDLAHLKKMEEDLRVADRLGIMGTIASGLAHEIKNPLGGIKGAAQLMLKNKANPEWVEYLEMIVKEAERVNQLLVDLLNFASPKKIIQSKFNVNKLLEEVLCLEEPAAQEEEIRILRFYDPSLPDIVGDYNQLKQVFLNLVKNAREVLQNKENALIEVSTHLFTDYQLKNEQGRAVRLIEVSIKDNGHGMSDEVLKNLFAPFFSTKKGGSGLGLAISHRIITEHQGFMQVESGLKHGTLFKVFLRAAST